MKNTTKKVFAVITALLFVIGMVQAPKKSFADTNLDLNVSAAISIEASTGKVLYEKNADSALGIASMSKMLTEYILWEKIKEGKIKWDQTYTPDDYVYKVSQDRSLSNVPLRKDGSYTIKELYHAMAIYSANAATIAIAESIAGSEKNFLKLMNATADKLGMKDYKFVNTTGLNNADLKGMYVAGGADDENVMSARDAAKLAYHLVNDHPDMLKTASIATEEFKEGTSDQIHMINWNTMLPTLSMAPKDYKVDGLKTGTTDFAGVCFTGTATKNGMRIITVVLNAKGNGHNSRFVETKKLMDYSFNNFSLKKVYDKGATIKGQKSVSVDKGKEKTVSVVTGKKATLVVKNGEEKNYASKVKIDRNKLNSNNKLEAPIKKGEQIGTLSLTMKDKNDDGYLYGQKSQNISVVTSKSVDKANWFVLSMRSIGGFFADVWHGITSTIKGWF